MRILIIEDDEPKIREMRSFIRSLPSCAEAQVQERMSYQSGLREIITHPPDLVLLDMSIPSYDRSVDDPKGGRPRPFGGRDILKEVRRSALKTKVIVVTQFAVLKDSNKEEKTLDELTVSLEREFADHFLGAIFYRHSENSWQEPLQRLIAQFVTAHLEGRES